MGTVMGIVVRPRPGFLAAAAAAVGHEGLCTWWRYHDLESTT